MKLSFNVWAFEPVIKMPINDNIAHNRGIFTIPKYNKFYSPASTW